MNEKTLSTEQLVARIGVESRYVPFYASLLVVDQQRGVVERTETGAWKLTPRAQAKYGEALRQITPPNEGED